MINVEFTEIEFHKLKKYLLLHESAIANKYSDYSDIECIFKLIIGRDPREAKRSS